MSDSVDAARMLLSAWKGENYVHGIDVLPRLGKLASSYGKRALVVISFRHEGLLLRVRQSLKEAGLEVIEAPAAKPNAPKEDVYRIATYLLQYKPQVLIAVGGGSTIDACKAADVLASLGDVITPEIDYYFGSGIVSFELKKQERKLIPLVAVQTSASSGSHLTKYANVTDIASGQKKLIVDEAVVPASSLFDYSVSATMPRSVTLDGILDAISHCYESFLGAKESNYALLEEITQSAFRLCLEYAPKVMADLHDMKGREAIGLATDLGGYAIMAGGTSGGHLTSFSLVRLVGHGTACGIMNPYYTVFYGKAVSRQLKSLVGLFAEYGYAERDDEKKEGRALSEAMARGMIAFSRSIGAPTTLGELSGFSPQYVEQALSAAKDPQLEMKLRNMPVPMSASDVDTYMAPILNAAVSGDFSLIRER